MSLRLYQKSQVGSSRCLLWHSRRRTACCVPEELFRRTRRGKPSGISGGRRIPFDRGFVIRYIDRIPVNDDGYGVSYKAGLRIASVLP